LISNKKDFHGSVDSMVGENTPLYGLSEDDDASLNINSALMHWLDNEFPPKKINLGLAGFVKINFNF
jgi:GH18 family chitinase